MISEHQSTINNNMPLRDVIYYGRTIEKLVEPRALYKTKMIGIPTPEFLVFYNGDHNFPPEKTLKLSDAFLEKTEEPMLELTVKIININLPIRHPVLERCRPLYEYSWFIKHIKTHMLGGHSRDEAIIAAIADCRTEGILVQRTVSSRAYSTSYPHQNCACESRRSPHYAVDSQTHFWRGYQALYAQELTVRCTRRLSERAWIGGGEYAVYRV